VDLISNIEISFVAQVSGADKPLISFKSPKQIGGPGGKHKG